MIFCSTVKEKNNLIDLFHHLDNASPISPCFSPEKSNENHTMLERNNNESHTQCVGLTAKSRCGSIQYVPYIQNSISLPVPMLLQNILCNFQTPMQQRLSNHLTSLDIPSSHTSSNDRITQLTSKPSLQSRTLELTTDLSRIIRASSSGVESSIPLEPAVRIAVGDPSRGFPHAQ